MTMFAQMIILGMGGAKEMRQTSDDAMRFLGFWRRFRPVFMMILLLCLAVAMGFGLSSYTNAAFFPGGPRPYVVSLPTLQDMIFVWASGTPAVQQLAQQQCTQLHLDTTACAQISEDVRATWQDMIDRDPAALGRVDVWPNLVARQQILQQFTVQLMRIFPVRLATFVQSTHTAAMQIHDPAWQRQALVKFGRPIPIGGYRLVWATAYLQTALPPGMTPTGSQYAALPDLYLSMVNMGNGANIPAIYQPYYLPTSGARWTVTVNNAFKTGVAPNVLITDVGPWNEDDNWWDANGTSATLPATCPVSATQVASDATSNSLVNGICPNGHNERRLYYYLLYQHGGLPFFQRSAYHPSGTFADGTAWPTTLNYLCAETAAAAINNDGISCAGNAPGTYNGNHGAWLRDGTNDAPVLNQASIDLSPAVDAALGWVYPSSGLVQVNVATLP